MTAAGSLYFPDQAHIYATDDHRIIWIDRDIQELIVNEVDLQPTDSFSDPHSNE